MTVQPTPTERPGLPWKRRATTLILILVLVIPLILMASKHGNETLALLLWYILWLGNLVFKALPQNVFWILFLCAALVIAVASLVSRRRKPWRKPEEKADRAGRVQLMAHAIRRTEHGAYFKWRLARYLAEMASEAVAGHGRVAVDERLAHLQRLGADISPELLAYFELGLGRGLLEPTDLLVRLRRFLRLETQPITLDLDPEVAVRFLEDQLEVSYDL